MDSERLVDFLPERRDPTFPADAMNSGSFDTNRWWDLVMQFHRSGNSESIWLVVSARLSSIATPMWNKSSPGALE